MRHLKQRNGIVNIDVYKSFQVLSGFYLTSPLY